MNQPTYVPILRAKQGEFTALEQLKEATKSMILPLLDVPKNTSRAKVPKTNDQHLLDIITSISGIWSGKPILLDAFSWSASSQTSEGEHILSYLRNQLEANGLLVSPVIGYDRWDDPLYCEAFKKMSLAEDRFFCIRLDLDAIDDISDIDFFKDRIDEILASIGKSSKECIVLLDLADLSQTSIMTLMTKIGDSIRVLQELGFKSQILAGSSIPETINIAVKNQESVGYLSRKEMLIWQALSISFPSLIYGDYGVRSPRSKDDVIAPDTNGKIRHTVGKNFFIARGYSLRTREKGAQHHKLADEVINSGHYLGEEFSWGDKRIASCARGEFRGNSTDWIAIDTNHHIHFAVVEVGEYLHKRNIFPVAALQEK